MKIEEMYFEKKQPEEYEIDERRITVENCTEWLEKAKFILAGRIQSTITTALLAVIMTTLTVKATKNFVATKRLLYIVETMITGSITFKLIKSTKNKLSEMKEAKELLTYTKYKLEQAKVKELIKNQNSTIYQQKN